MLRFAVPAVVTAALLAPAVPVPAAPATPSTPAAQRECAIPDRGHMSCLAYRRTDVRHAKGVAAAAPSGYSPADLASAYALPSGTAGAGETVAITIAYGNPHLESDLAVYREQYGLPPCTTANGCLRKIDQRGGTDYPIPDEQWGGELDLDVDMVSAACPLCHLLVVEADDNSEANLFAAIDQAVAQGATFVSNSWAARRTPTPPPNWTSTSSTPVSRSPSAAATTASSSSTRRSPSTSPRSAARRCAAPATIGAGRSRRGAAPVPDVLGRSPNRPGRPIRSARTGWRPTSRRWPTRSPAWPSTTRAGRSSAAPASPRR
jgi:hypothetical protein